MPSDPFIGEIFMAGYNFAPQGYLPCQGQLLSIAQNTTLFALIGVAYGGNGTTTFGLPDMRGRVPVGMGAAASGNNYVIGQVTGSETVTLDTTQMPAHTHTLVASNDAGDTASPSAAFPAFTGALDKEYKGTLTNAVNMNPAAVSAAGNSQPHSNMQPSLVINFYIANAGLFPQRP